MASQKESFKRLQRFKEHKVSKRSCTAMSAPSNWSLNWCKDISTFGKNTHTHTQLVFLSDEPCCNESARKNHIHWLRGTGQNKKHTENKQSQSALFKNITECIRKNAHRIDGRNGQTQKMRFPALEKMSWQKNMYFSIQCGQFIN